MIIADTNEFIMHAISENKNLLLNFVTYAKNQFGINIKTLRFDNGQEFTYIDLYNNVGAIHQKGCFETP